MVFYVFSKQSKMIFDINMCFLKIGSSFLGINQLAFSAGKYWYY